MSGKPLVKRKRCGLRPDLPRLTRARRIPDGSPYG